MQGIPAILYLRMQNRSVPMTGAALNPDNKHSTRSCQMAGTGRFPLRIKFRNFC